MDLATIKKALRLLGIRNLSVKFEPQAELIRTSFNYQGQHSEETISFQDIENILTDTEIKPDNTPQIDIPTNCG